jgi:hypothetical protein
MGLYAANGSINIAEGTSGTGLYTPEGYWRVTQDPDTGPCGLYAPDGSLYVMLGGSNRGRYSPNGSWYVNTTDNLSGHLFVTVVTGSIT